MAMSASIMANLIVTQLEALNPEIDDQPGARAQLLTNWTAICTGIISHITTAAVVNATGTGTATVTSAPGTAPVSTTDVGTIS